MVVSTNLDYLLIKQIDRLSKQEKWGSRSKAMKKLIEEALVKRGIEISLTSSPKKKCLSVKEEKPIPVADIRFDPNKTMEEQFKQFPEMRRLMEKSAQPEQIEEEYYEVEEEASPEIGFFTAKKPLTPDQQAKLRKQRAQQVRKEIEENL